MVLVQAARQTQQLVLHQLKQAATALALPRRPTLPPVLHQLKPVATALGRLPQLTLLRALHQLKRVDTVLVQAVRLTQLPVLRQLRPAVTALALPRRPTLLLVHRALRQVDTDTALALPRLPRPLPRPRLPLLPHHQQPVTAHQASQLLVVTPPQLLRHRLLPAHRVQAQADTAPVALATVVPLARAQALDMATRC